MRCRAAIDGADIVVGAKQPDALPFSSLKTFLDQLANHTDKPGMIAWRAGATEMHAKFVKEMFGGVVEVVENFHVIREKSDGGDHEAATALAVQFTNEVQNVRFKPGIFRPTTAT